MPKQKLQNLLTELHESIGDVEPSSAQMDLLDSVKRLAYTEGTTAPAEPDLLDALELWVEEQSEDHPAAAGIIQQIIKTLGDIGI